MSTTTRSNSFKSFLLTVVLGSAMAVGIHVLAEPDLAWAGFVIAAICRSFSRDGRSCRARAGSASKA